ncbi:3-oxoacyl-[acyl-carrier-protein] reductase FabG [Cedecea neteri]|uniref:3-oxoacyl-[acyl-carrier-protein] reductase FabG n=1 Tax=Cedecea neteri TaxID=158822 RepID=A0A291E631_9ENTR|nr:SDR family oxidoreductase [Cedecea neteri]ATF95524.1 beta-ketoacyl-ACP reductase [Cedecea neteri]SQC92027.1 3-oxoacyl-[acyl-carrier-protein] reductase FabG [Cedecea neteri]
MAANNVALVTGGNGGIGSAITRRLVSDGFRVIVAYSPAEESAAQKWYRAEEYSEKDVTLLPMDVTDTNGCERNINKILATEKYIDVLVNNAGITRDVAFKKMSASQWVDVINVNINSLFNVTRPLFPAMCERGYGRIINISSVNGLKGQFGQVNYSTSKAGVIGFTKALAAEGAKVGVTVNAIAPGYTGTPMVEAMKPDVLAAITEEIPVRRLATPDEIAAAVSFLASREAAYITGETLSVNGGLYMR